MSEEPVTRREWQDSLEALQSAMNDGLAMHQSITDELRKAVTNLKDLPDDLRQEIVKLWLALNDMSNLIQQRSQRHMKVQMDILNLMGRMIDSSVHGMRR